MVEEELLRVPVTVEPPVVVDVGKRTKLWPEERRESKKKEQYSMKRRQQGCYCYHRCYDGGIFSF